MDAPRLWAGRGESECPPGCGLVEGRVNAPRLWAGRGESEKDGCPQAVGGSRVRKDAPGLYSTRGGPQNVDGLVEVANGLSDCIVYT